MAKRRKRAANPETIGDLMPGDAVSLNDRRYTLSIRLSDGWLCRMRIGDRGEGTPKEEIDETEPVHFFPSEQKFFSLTKHTTAKFIADGDDTDPLKKGKGRK